MFFDNDRKERFIMRKNNIKCAALALTLAASLLLSACGKTASDTENTDDAQSADTTATAADAVSASDDVKIRIDGTKFTVSGKEIWINGVNTPWDNWNDFGGDFDEAFWDEHFSKLHDAGINASRVWINCNGQTAIRLKSTGEVKEVNEKHWQDLDKLFDIAEKHHIYLMPTFLSFDHFKDGNSGAEQWRMLVQDDTLIQSYIDKYVNVFMDRYADEPYLWAIDLMNEPDWVVENAECGRIGWDKMSNFFAKVSAAIHEKSEDTLVTVGLGMIKYNSDKFQGNMISDEHMKELAGDKAYVDFYSTHYYFWQNGSMGYPFEESPTDFGLDGTKPAVIGEFAVLSESGRTVAQEYENAYNNGWNGALAWTSNGVDNCGGFDDLKPAADRMSEIAEDKIFPLGK